MERIEMSQEERDRLDWLKRARDKKMTQREAAEKMEVSERWVRKMLKRMKEQGDAVVVHGLRGRASNRKLPAAKQKQVLAVLQEPDWHDFGPTFAAQQLAKRHKLDVSNTAQVVRIALSHGLIESGADAQALRSEPG